MLTCTELFFFYIQQITVISSSAGTVAELDFMDSADSILDVYTVSHASSCSLDILYQIVFIKM